MRRMSAARPNDPPETGVAAAGTGVLDRCGIDVDPPGTGVRDRCTGVLGPQLDTEGTDGFRSLWGEARWNIPFVGLRPGDASEAAGDISARDAAGEASDATGGRRTLERGGATPGFYRISD